MRQYSFRLRRKLITYHRRHLHAQLVTLTDRFGGRCDLGGRCRGTKHVLYILRRCRAHPLAYSHTSWRFIIRVIRHAVVYVLWVITLCITRLTEVVWSSAEDSRTTVYSSENAGNSYVINFSISIWPCTMTWQADNAFPYKDSVTFEDI